MKEKELQKFPNEKMEFPSSLESECCVSAKDPENERFFSFRNGILTLNKDGTWQWDERPE